MKNLKSFEKIILDNFVYNILLISSLILCEVLVFLSFNVFTVYGRTELGLNGSVLILARSRK